MLCDLANTQDFCGQIVGETIHTNEKNLKEWGYSQKEIIADRKRLQSCICEAQITLEDIEEIENKYLPKSNPNLALSD